MTLDARPFGELHSELLSPGDLVKWSIWNNITGTWDKKYGVIIKIRNQVKSNRLVSISEVYIYERDEIKEFFFFFLKKVHNNEEFSGLYSNIG